MEKFLGAVIGGAITSLLRGWLFMLAVGVAHAEWVPALPTIGYWWAVVLCSLFPIASYSSRRESRR